MTVGVDLPPVVQAGAAAKPAPPVPGADPAGADAFLPAFVEPRTLPTLRARSTASAGAAGSAIPRAPGARLSACSAPG